MPQLTFYLLYLNGDIIRDKQMDRWPHNGCNLGVPQPPSLHGEAANLKTEISNLFWKSLFNMTCIGGKTFKVNAIYCALQVCFSSLDFYETKVNMEHTIFCCTL